MQQISKNSIDTISRIKTDTFNEVAAVIDANPIHNFRADWDEVKSFHRRHSDWNLPADIGRGWISRLTEEELCICGRIMDDEHRKHIESNIDEYLDEVKEQRSLIDAGRISINWLGSNGDEVTMAIGELLDVTADELKQTQELYGKPSLIRTHRRKLLKKGGN